MNKVHQVVLFFLLAICVAGQPNASDVEVAASNPTASQKNDPNVAASKKSGIEIPPEKARPITVPKIELAMTIDGRPDEEAWKNAAVFNDFYQTSPGDNKAAL